MKSGLTLEMNSEQCGKSILKQRKKIMEDIESPDPESNGGLLLELREISGGWQAHLICYRVFSYCLSRQICERKKMKCREQR